MKKKMWKNWEISKTLTPNKLFNKLPVLLAQIKAGNNLQKLKSEIISFVSKQ